MGTALCLPGLRCARSSSRFSRDEHVPSQDTKRQDFGQEGYKRASQTWSVHMLADVLLLLTPFSYCILEEVANAPVHWCHRPFPRSLFREAVLCPGPRAHDRPERRRREPRLHGLQVRPQQRRRRRRHHGPHRRPGLRRQRRGCRTPKSCMDHLASRKGVTRRFRMKRFHQPHCVHQKFDDKPAGLGIATKKVFPGMTGHEKGCFREDICAGSGTTP